MDTWKFFDITHRDHIICNPTSVGKLQALVRLLDLPGDPRVLDIACGKGELFLRLGERYGAASGAGFHGVAIDISPFHVAELREAAARRIPAASIEILQMGGADYRAGPGSFDLACCVGASWVFQGHRGTLHAMRHAVRPGGQILVGEPFWISEPSLDYLAWSGMRREEFGTHAENVTAGEAEGLVPLLALASNTDDWDTYEALQWRAAARYAASNPEDPDVPELLERVSHSRHEYLTWGRQTLGWALYLFGRPLGD